MKKRKLIISMFFLPFVLYYSYNLLYKSYCLESIMIRVIEQDNEVGKIYKFKNFLGKASEYIDYITVQDGYNTAQSFEKMALFIGKIKVVSFRTKIDTISSDVEEIQLDFDVGTNERYVCNPESSVRVSRIDKDYKSISLEPIGCVTKYIDNL